MELKMGLHSRSALSALVVDQSNWPTRPKSWTVLFVSRLQ